MKTTIALLLCTLFITIQSQQQYTPNQAQWSAMKKGPQDPDSVSWLSKETWEKAKWDGVSVYNPAKMKPDQFWKAICPHVDTIRGIRELFYKKKPFKDNSNPTKAEIDNWHAIALTHVRNLIGYPMPEYQAKPDTCMFARALWGQERRFTTKWDGKYPGRTGSAAGPCQGSNNAHCGATFIPDYDDQKPYLPSGHPACRTQGGSEGVLGGPKADIPWSLKWSRGLCNTLAKEGFWGGHVGPFFHREKFGFSFWGSSGLSLRAKWTGKRLASLYCYPGKEDCDRETTGPKLPAGRKWGPLVIEQGAVKEDPIDKMKAKNNKGYLGCFIDRKYKRDFKSYHGYNNDIESCRAIAKRLEHKYFGLQWTGQCFTGDTVGRWGVGEESTCNTPCKTKPNEMCGGGNRNSVYRTNASGSPTPTPTPRPTPTPTPTPTPSEAGENGYLGCFGDARRRDLPSRHSGGKFTIETCRAKAKEHGHKYFGLQYKGECFSGNAYGKYGKKDENSCNTPCTADKNQMCGGGWRNSMYETVPGEEDEAVSLEAELAALADAEDFAVAELEENVQQDVFGQLEEVLYERVL